jgi:ABC-type transport system substrate-binding protein
VAQDRETADRIYAGRNVSGYPQPKGATFNPAEARRLLGEAGYPVVQNTDGSFSCPKFPVDQVEFIYNTRQQTSPWPNGCRRSGNRTSASLWA